MLNVLFGFINSTKPSFPRNWLVPTRLIQQFVISTSFRWFRAKSVFYQVLHCWNHRPSSILFHSKPSNSSSYHFLWQSEIGFDLHKYLFFPVSSRFSAGFHRHSLPIFCPFANSFLADLWVLQYHFIIILHWMFYLQRFLEPVETQTAQRNLELLMHSFRKIQATQPTEISLFFTKLILFIFKNPFP